MIENMERPSDVVLEPVPDIFARIVDDPPGMDCFRAVAAHEAAHAVVTDGFGITVQRILVVQRTILFKRLYKGQIPREDGSYSQPYKTQRCAAGQIARCLIARAGEIGQRLHVGDNDNVDPEDWRSDRKDISDETGMPETELGGFLETLRIAVEPWLKEPEQERIWRQLSERLSNNPEHADKDPDRYRKALEAEELQNLLKETPQFPADRIPAMPRPAKEPEATAEPAS